MSKILLSSIETGALTLKNRVFMAPMTRSRAVQNAPTDLTVQYYAQRASAGLIISEGVQVSEQGIGYINTPGIHTKAQAQAWKKVTDAVHQKGGTIFAQLWHVGRASHPDFHGGKLPVAPSAVGFEGDVYTPEGPKKTVTPRALEISEIKNIVGDYENAARMAKEAGFDGVEIHGANGYLPAQFLEDGSNHRTDEYGGSVENRARFLLEITDAAIKVWGADRVAVRISPGNPFNGMTESNPEAIYSYVAKELDARKIGFLHVLESLSMPARVAPKLRKLFTGTLILNAGFTRETAEKTLENGEADAIAFGTLFISNPDLPVRFAENAPLANAERATFYGGDAKGYVDYPSLGGRTA